MKPTDRILVLGASGMLGSAIVRLLHARGFTNVIATLRNDDGYRDPDLTDPFHTENYMDDAKPDVVIMAAGRVGGIAANDNNPVEFLTANASMALNSIQAAYRAGVKTFLYVGSSCMYPREAPQPMEERDLLSGPFEPTNEAYALAKMVGVKLCSYYLRQHGVNYFSALPPNLYGPGDNYHPGTSHAVAAMIRRFHEAKVDGASEVTCWGSGNPIREFMHVDDCASACLFLLETVDIRHLSYPHAWINIGPGEPMSISTLAWKVRGEIFSHGLSPAIKWDKERPDGHPEKVMNFSQIRDMGWTPSITLKDGLRDAYQDFLRRHSTSTEPAPQSAPSEPSPVSPAPSSDPQ